MSDDTSSHVRVSHLYDELLLCFWYEDWTRKYDPKAHEKHPRREKRNVKTERNEDEIDESHKSQLKFQCDFYLLNYIIKIKYIKPKLNFRCSKVI